MESKPMSRPLPTEIYSLNLVRPPRSVWLYPANTSSLMWKALKQCVWGDQSGGFIGVGMGWDVVGMRHGWAHKQAADADRKSVV